MASMLEKVHRWVFKFADRDNWFIHFEMRTRIEISDQQNCLPLIRWGKSQLG